MTSARNGRSVSVLHDFFRFFVRDGTKSFFEKLTGLPEKPVTPSLSAYFSFTFRKMCR
jgi:hypothetical protein